MPNLQVKNSFGQNIFIKAVGSGTTNDPYIPVQQISIVDTLLPPITGAATENTLATVKTLGQEALGQLGHNFITATTPQTGLWVAIQIVTNATLTSLTCYNTAAPAINVELPTGFILYGNITGFTLSYGAVIAYKGV